MSAYVLEDRETSRLARDIFARIAEFGPVRAERLGFGELVTGSPEELAEKLYQLNVEAVAQRYSLHRERTPVQFIPGAGLSSSPVRGYKLLQCYLYQCSEGNVPETALFKQLSALAGDIAQDIVQSLPAYDDAPWGI
jgi:hypothetical protein